MQTPELDSHDPLPTANKNELLSTINEGGSSMSDTYKHQSQMTSRLFVDASSQDLESIQSHHNLEIYKDSPSPVCKRKNDSSLEIISVKCIKPTKG